MSPKDPLEKSKEEFSYILNRIQADSQVGIDAPLTHAIIIEYLQDIQRKLKTLEEKINNNT